MTNTPDQIKERFVVLMGDELGTIYYKLYNQVIFLHHQWITYLELFATEKVRLEILNKSAPYLFYMIQNGLFENIVMSIARITDPPASGKFQNLTLGLLPKYIVDENLKKEVELQIEWYVSKAVEFARELRNKKFAHQDYDLHTGSAVLQVLSKKEDIEIALKSIRNLMNSITKHFDGSMTIFMQMSTNNGALGLLRTLQDGKNAQKYVEKLERDGRFVDEILIQHSIDYSDRHFELE